MTIQEAFNRTTQEFKKAKIDNPSLDAEVLLAFALNISKEELYIHNEAKLAKDQIALVQEVINRRIKREPVAYITGHKEFFGLDLIVDKRVLIPRSETELLVELTLHEIKNLKPEAKNVTVVDIGTGSGAIIVAVAKSLSVYQFSSSAVKFFASDISRDALQVARLNARRHELERRISFLRGNLLEPLLKTEKLKNRKTDKLVITVNLPYLPTKKWRKAMPDVNFFEPRAALDGGSDGLGLYRQLFEQLRELRVTKTAVFCEIDPHQVHDIQVMASFYFPKYRLKVIKDLASLDRVVALQL